MWTQRLGSRAGGVLTPFASLWQPESPRVSSRRNFGTALILACGLPWVSSCVTSKAPAPSQTTAQAQIATPAPRKLPPTSHIDLANDPYPQQAKAQGLTGRVLVEFHIDRDGKVVSPQILAADADEMLQKAALAALETVTYDISQPDFAAADPKPYRVTVRFCLPSCKAIANFPGTEDIAIRGSPIR